MDKKVEGRLGPGECRFFSGSSTRTCRQVASRVGEAAKVAEGGRQVKDRTRPCGP